MRNIHNKDNLAEPYAGPNTRDNKTTKSNINKKRKLSNNLDFFSSADLYFDNLVSWYQEEDNYEQKFKPKKSTQINFVDEDDINFLNDDIPESIDTTETDNFKSVRSIPILQPKFSFSSSRSTSELINSNDTNNSKLDETTDFTTTINTLGPQHSKNTKADEFETSEIAGKKSFTIGNYSFKFPSCHKKHGRKKNEPILLEDNTREKERFANDDLELNYIDLEKNRSQIKITKWSKPNFQLTVPILLCMAISFGGFIFGWDVGTIGTIVNMKGFRDQFGTRYRDDGEKGFSDIVLGLIISIFNIGCAIGGITLAKLGDFIGRKKGIAVSIYFFILGLIIEMVQGDHWIQFFVGRITCGFCVGSLAVLIPMFISESAPVRIRGAMVAMYQIMITLGILMGNLCNHLVIKYLPEEQSDLDWCFPVGLNVVWCFILGIGLAKIPESPQFLALKKMDRRGAMRSFAIMNNVSINDQSTKDFICDMDEEFLRINRMKFKEKKHWHDFITGKPRLGLRLFIGIMLMIFQQLTGINYFFYYITSIFKSIGVSDPYLATIYLSLVNFLSGFGSIYFVEKLGRKVTLVFGSLGMFICMVVYSTLGCFLLDKSGTSIGMIAVTCLFISCFAMSSGPVTFVIVSEIFPMRTKNISIATCTAASWILNFIISLLTPLIISRINFFLGYIFAGCLLCSIFFIFFLVPETKGKNSTEVDQMYEK